MFKEFILAAGLIAFGTPAHAALVLGSNVDSLWFGSIFGSTDGWVYLGGDTPTLFGPGEFTLQLRDSGYANSFGYGTADHLSATEIFSGTAAVGSTALVGGLASSTLYFNTDAPGTVDDTRQWSDGFATGGSFGVTQAGMDIFRNTGINTYALFYDDGGMGGAADDNDYNDLVVSYKPTAAAPPVEQPVHVPEPAALSLLGAALLWFGLRARHNSARSVP